MLTRDERNSDAMYDFIDECSDIKYFAWWKLPIILLPFSVSAVLFLFFCYKVVLGAAWYVHLITEGHTQLYAFKHSYNAYTNVYILLNDINNTAPYISVFEYFLTLMVVLFIAACVIIFGILVYNKIIELLIIRDMISSCSADELKSLIYNDTDKDRQNVRNKLTKFRKRMSHKDRQRLDVSTFLAAMVISMTLVVFPIAFGLGIPKQSVTKVDWNTFTEYGRMYFNYYADSEFRDAIDNTEYFE